MTADPSLVEATGREEGSMAGALAAQEARLLTCVHCGFCLPACPTYTRLGHEGDSPRGRLHLMRAVAEGRLDAASPAFQTHIDRCLGCRACETVCPSGVEYGVLLERARHEAAEARRPSLATRGLLALFRREWATRWTLAASRLLRASRVPSLVARWTPASGPLRSVKLASGMLAGSLPWSPETALKRTARAREGAAPDRADGGGGNGAGADLRKGGAPQEGAGHRSGVRVQTPAGGQDPTAGSPAAEPVRLSGRGAVPGAERQEPGRWRPPGEAGRDPDGDEVAILSGCVQEGLFGRVNRATRRVLEANGCRVHDAPEQGCCGALHAHGGDLEAARDLARRNVDAFEATGVDRVVVNAAGCGAFMKEYGDLLADDPYYALRAAAVAERVRDVSEVLAARGPVEGGELPVRVTYDAPCHLLHGQGIDREARAVLAAVPGLEVVPLERADECCGGAGIYGITHAELGGRIGGDKVSAVRATGAAVVATGNPGCMMQIGAGLRMEGAAVDAVHPVELLDESYRRGGVYRRKGLG